MKINIYYLLLFVMTFSLMSSCQKERIYIIETEYGIMKMKLLPHTPLHAENFKKLVDEGYYDGTLFHRIVTDKLIQGGDPDSKNAQPGQNLGIGGPDYTIPAEIGTPHFRGMVAAARLGTQMNPQKASSGSQFYIIKGQQVSDQELDVMERAKGIKYSEAQREKYLRIGGLPSLDNDYTVFGEIIEGLDVIDKIVAVPVGDNERPLKDVKMKVY